MSDIKRELRKAIIYKNIDDFIANEATPVQKYNAIMSQSSYFWEGLTYIIPKISYYTVTDMHYSVFIRESYYAEKLMRVSRGNKSLPDEERQAKITFLITLLDILKKWQYNMNLPSQQTKFTPLMNAMTYHNYDIMMLLVKYGASFDYRIGSIGNHLYYYLLTLVDVYQNMTKLNRNTFSSAERNYYEKGPEVIRFMLDHKCKQYINDSRVDFPFPGKSKETPLHLLSRVPATPKFVEILEMFVDAGADFTIKDANGKTPIELAKYLNNINMANLMYNSKTNIANQTIKGLLMTEKQLSLSKPLPYDVLSKIATKVAKMNSSEAAIYDKETYNRMKNGKKLSIATKSLSPKPIQYDKMTVSDLIAMSPYKGVSIPLQVRKQDLIRKLLLQEDPNNLSIEHLQILMKSLRVTADKTKNWKKKDYLEYIRKNGDILDE